MVVPAAASSAGSVASGAFRGRLDTAPPLAVAAGANAVNLSLDLLLVLGLLQLGDLRAHLLLLLLPLARGGGRTCMHDRDRPPIS